MIPIALITCKKYPHLDDDNALLIKQFQEMGYSPNPVVWNQNSVEWKKFKAIILRSPWDYHRHINDFYVWLEVIESLSIPVWNPIPIQRWNSDKFRYLSDLSKKHIPIIPSVFLDKGTLINLDYLLHQKKWGAAVVKPRFGGSSIGVYTVSLSNAKKYQKQFRESLKKNDCIVQKYVKEVGNGEYSFLFINRKFSHAVLRKPKQGKTAINSVEDEILKLVRPETNLIRQATRVIDAVDTILLYARVDAFLVNGNLIVNELELIDPILYFGINPLAAKTFVSEFKKLLS